MEQSKKLLIGFDLCEDYTQISCYSYKTFEPESVCQTETEEENACLIPTALCLKNNSDLRLIGEEAMACAKNKEGILVNHLYQSLQSGETVMIEGKPYPPDYLLEKYFRKAFPK